MGKCLTRCPLLPTGLAWAARGSMCEVTGWATPTGSNAPLYGSTDTKSPMVYSSMVHVAGGEGGSTRYDDDGRPAPSGGSPVSDGRWVHDGQVAPMIDLNRLRELTAELGFMPATPDGPDIERHRELNAASDYWLGPAASIRSPAPEARASETAFARNAPVIEAKDLRSEAAIKRRNWRCTERDPHGRQVQDPPPVGAGAPPAAEARRF